MKLTVEIRHSDGTREEISLADAILIYEKRRDAAKDERERRHCEQRIADLQKRWKKALRGTERAKTSATVKPSERPTKTRTQRRARRPVSADDETR